MSAKTLVASDGKEFSSRDEWRKYEFALRYTVKNKTNEKVVRHPGEIDGQPFDLQDLDGCEVLLLDHCDQVQVDNVKNSRLFIGPSSESVFIRDCANCTVTVACKQLRTRDCHNLTLYLYCMTDPIIETSDGIQVAPFNGSFPKLDMCFTAARLDPRNNHWQNVYDFNDEQKTGKNWKIIPKPEREQTWVVPFAEGAAGKDECINPVPEDAVSTTTEEQLQGLTTYAIKRSHKEELLESKQEHPLPPSKAPASMPPTIPIPKQAVLSQAKPTPSTDVEQALRSFKWRIKWAPNLRLLYVFYQLDHEAIEESLYAKLASFMMTTCKVLHRASQALASKKIKIWWDPVVEKDRTRLSMRLQSTDEQLAGLILVPDEFVACRQGMEAVAHPIVPAGNSEFVEISSFEAPPMLIDTEGRILPEVEDMEPALASYISQLALMLDAFALQHGIVEDSSNSEIEEAGPVSVPSSTQPSQQSEAPHAIDSSSRERLAHGMQPQKEPSSQAGRGQDDDKKKAANPIPKANAFSTVKQFVASDGKAFDSRDAWRKYEFELKYTFRNRTDQKLVRYPGDVDGQPFDIADIKNCEVLLLDHTDQVQVDNVENSTLFIGPSSESVFLRSCSDCVLTIACKQLRTRDCKNLEIYLYSQTDPIIETSSNMRFAPFNGAYSGLRETFRLAQLDPNNNHWQAVYDFNDEMKTGINWRLLAVEERRPQWTVDVPNAVEECMNPVPAEAVSTTTLEQQEGKAGKGSRMQSFSLSTSQKEAEVLLSEPTSSS